MNTNPVGTIGGVNFDTLQIANATTKNTRNFNKLVATGKPENVRFAFNLIFAGGESSKNRDILEKQIKLSGDNFAAYQRDVIGRFSGALLPPPGVKYQKEYPNGNDYVKAVYAFYDENKLER